MKRVSIMLIVSLAVGAAVACAQQIVSPTQDQAARTLIRHVWFRSGVIDVMLDQGVRAAEPSLAQLTQLLEQRGGPLTSDERDRVRRALRRALEEALLSRDFEDAGVRIYSRRFSEGELRQLLDFYRTPLGEKVARETAGIMTEFEEAGHRLGNSPSFQRRVAEAVKAALPTRRLE